jgi:hypothetical protein
MALPPRPDQGLPIAPVIPSLPLPPIPPGGVVTPPIQSTLPGLNEPPLNALGWLRIFFPGFFDPNSPQYIDPQSMIIVMLDLAEEFRPSCLSDKLQNIAQAYYAAYLLQDWQNQISSGGGDTTTNSGIVLSEKEGDISVTYADPRTTTGAGSEVTTPPKGPWEKWHRMWSLCKHGAILTKYGEPT